MSRFRFILALSWAIVALALPHYESKGSSLSPLSPRALLATQLLLVKIGHTVAQTICVAILHWSVVLDAYQIATRKLRADNTRI